MTLAALLLLALLPAADIHGTVRAEGSGAPIPRATVQVVELKRSATTDERGAFVLRGVDDGRWTVRTSALGYRPHSVVVRATGGGSVRLDVDLRPEAVRLEPVEVRGRGEGTAVSRSGPAPLPRASSAPSSPTRWRCTCYLTALDTAYTRSRQGRGDAVRENAAAAVEITGAYGLFVGTASARRRIVFVLSGA